jgi:uncharacterized protein (DUF1778 family)
MSIAIKNKRIDIRVPEEIKEVLMTAAKLSGLTLSSYIISVSYKKAEMDLKENENLVLSNRDRDLLLSALNKIEEPNNKLKGLFNK